MRHAEVVNTLSAMVTNAMRLDLLTGDLFLFVSKDRKRSNVLYFDDTGMCLFAKRLDQGKFVALWKRHRAGKELTLTLSEIGLSSKVRARSVRRSVCH